MYIKIRQCTHRCSTLLCWPPFQHLFHYHLQTSITQSHLVISSSRLSGISPNTLTFVIRAQLSWLSLVFSWWALLSVSAMSKLVPLTNTNWMSYLWYFIMMSWRCLGAWLKGFCNMVARGLWSFSTFTGLPYVYWSNFSRPYKTDRASFSICAQFLSDGDNVRDTYSTIRDDLLEAELHRFHVCDYPIESQPLL